MISWYLILARRKSAQILWRTLCSKLDNGSVLMMQYSVLISHTNYSRCQLLWKRRPRIRNLTRTHLESSPGVVKHPSGVPTTVTLPHVSWSLFFFIFFNISCQDTQMILIRMICLNENTYNEPRNNPYSSTNLGRDFIPILKFTACTLLSIIETYFLFLYIFLSLHCSSSYLVSKYKKLVNVIDIENILQ